MADLRRETARTTSTMAMSTARAEATLVVLEAERAQLERRLEKVKNSSSVYFCRRVAYWMMLVFFWIPFVLLSCIASVHDTEGLR